MLVPKLDKVESVFRNENIFAPDVKAINLDNVLVAAFMLMRNNGSRIKLKLGNKFHTTESLNTYFEVLERKGNIKGASEHPEAVEAWLRSSLINMVFRGKADKENVASLRPLHLESYRIRNQKHTKDYNTADQLYIMIRQRPEIMEALKNYMSIGWDNNSKLVTSDSQVDVDTAGVLQLMSLVEIDPKVTTASLNYVKPILEKQADLFCEDVKRLLYYQKSIPRSVFIEYLRVLTGFHLSLYFQKLIKALPQMIFDGEVKSDYDWNIVVDMTDSLEGNVANIACADMESELNGLMDYITSTMKINAVGKYLNEPNNINLILQTIKNRPDDFESYFRFKLNAIIERYDEVAEDPEEAKQSKEELKQYLEYENSFFDKYISCVAKVRAPYQYRYSYQFFDSASMKNQDSAFLADGRSRKHPRRAVIGSKLLEVLVQLVVLTPKDGLYESYSLSINELISRLRNRYGLIIDGTQEERFKDADITTHLAFRENVESLKNKLRQIGFYTDLSDASILQKIRPRYNVNNQ
ncbi:MAG: hypothetical protein NC335_07940 [Bacteroides sp.]|nr:hypothetical protein [Bacteroides sp.]